MKQEPVQVFPLVQVELRTVTAHRGSHLGDPGSPGTAPTSRLGSAAPSAPPLFKILRKLPVPGQSARTQAPSKF